METPVPERSRGLAGGKSGYSSDSTSFVWTPLSSRGVDGGSRGTELSLVQGPYQAR